MAENRESALRIPGVNIRHCENFARPEAEFAQRVYLVGPDAAGKSACRICFAGCEIA